MKEFHLEIVTPDGLEFDGMVESLLVNSDNGYVEFLAGHIDYITPLTIGKARIKHQGKDKYAAISGGFVTISNGEVKLVAVTFEFADDIDVERAKRSKARAEEEIRRATNDKELLLAKARLRRAMSRIDVVGK